MDTCKRILSITHGQNFDNAVAYFSGKVTDILSNEQIVNKKKYRLLEVRTGQGIRRGRGHVRRRSNIYNSGGGYVRGGHS